MPGTLGGSIYRIEGLGPSLAWAPGFEPRSRRAARPPSERKPVQANGTTFVALVVAFAFGAWLGPILFAPVESSEPQPKKKSPEKGGSNQGSGKSSKAVAKLEKEKKALAKELDAAEKKANQLQNKLDPIRKESNERKKALEKAEARVEELEKEHSRSKGRVAKLTVDLKAAQGEVRDLEKALKKAKKDDGGKKAKPAKGDAPAAKSDDETSPEERIGMLEQALEAAQNQLSEAQDERDALKDQLAAQEGTEAKDAPKAQPAEEESKEAASA